MHRSLLRILSAGLAVFVHTAAAGVLFDRDPAGYSARIDGPLQDQALDMHVDSEGNVYLAGSFSSPDLKLQVFGDDPATTTGAAREQFAQTRLLRNAGSDDLFVAKYDSTGRLLWARSAGGAGRDSANGIVTDNAGNVYITGSFSGEADIGGVTVDASTLRTVATGQGAVTSSGLNLESNAFAAMLSPDGQWRWVRAFPLKLQNTGGNPVFKKYRWIDWGNSQPVSPGYEHAGTEAYNGDIGWTQPTSPAPQSAPTEFVTGDAPGYESSAILMTDDAGTARGWTISLPEGTYRFQLWAGDNDGPEDYQHVRWNIPGGNPADAINSGGNVVSSALIQFTIPAGGGYLFLRAGSNEDFTMLNYMKIDRQEPGPGDVAIGGTLGVRSGESTNPGRALAIDKDGNLFLKGRFVGNPGKASGAASMKLEAVAPSGDAFLIDDDSAAVPSAQAFVAQLKAPAFGGSVSNGADWTWGWVTPFSDSLTRGGSAGVIISDLAIDASGDVVAGGSWRGGLLAGGTSPVLSTGATAGAVPNAEGFVVRLSKTTGFRNLLSTIRVNQSSDTGRAAGVEALVADSLGNIFVAGNYNNRAGAAAVAGTWLFRASQATGPVKTGQAASVSDFFVAALNPVGEWSWITDPAGTGRRSVHALTRDATGAFYVSGAIHQGPSAFGATTLTPATAASEPFVAKLVANADGTGASWTAAMREEAQAGAHLRTGSMAGSPFGLVTSGGVALEADTGFTGGSVGADAAALAPVSVTPAGWTVEVFKGSGVVSTLTAADAAISSGTLRARVTGVPAINYGDGATGLVAGDAALPVALEDNLAIKATCQFHVNAPGDYTLKINNDDGGRLRIDGVDRITDNTTHSPQTFTAVVALSVGVHTAEYVFFNASAGMAGELSFRAPGGSSDELLAPADVISGTAEDALFWRYRYGPAFSWARTIPDGSYRVTLYFAETFWAFAGRRKFDVAIEGRQVENDLDIFAVSGGKNVALVRSYTATVSDGVLNIQFTGTVGALDTNALINAIVVEGIGGSHHGRHLAAAPNGTLWWSVSNGADTAAASTLPGLWAPGTRSGTNRTFDRMEGYGSLLLAADLDLKPPLPFNSEGYYAGQEIPIPAAFRPSGTVPTIRVKVGGQSVASWSSWFYWDGLARKLYAVSPTPAGQDVSIEFLGSDFQTVIGSISAPTRWPDAERGEPLQMHVVGAVASQVSVELEPQGANHSFNQILYTSAGAAMSGIKVFSAANEGWSTLLYSEGAGTSITTAPAKLVVVKTSMYLTNPALVKSSPADIGSAIDPTAAPAFHWNSPTAPQNFNRAGKTGFVATELPRIDATGADAAYRIADRTGEIIPVNLPDPADPDGGLVVIWSSRDAAGMNVAWPTNAVRYTVAWPASPERIIIASGLGSEVDLYGAAGAVPAVAVNAGGPAMTVAGITYEADRDFTGGTPIAALTSAAGPLASARTGTDFSCVLSVPDGAYQVTLAFAEQKPGESVDGPDGAVAPAALPKRGTTVEIEGREVLTAFRILAEAGDYNTGVERTFNTVVNDGVLNLRFVRAQGFDEAQINAIRVVPAARYSQTVLDDSKFRSPRIYHQPDRTLPGYNPNEEHALLAPGQNSVFPAVFALRSDLNNRGATTSEPYALLKYQDADDGLRWKFRVYAVSLTGTITAGTTPHVFDFQAINGFAGKRIQPPYPLSRYPDHPRTTFEDPPAGIVNAFWQDHKGGVWARSAGKVIAKFFYDLQPDFWFDPNGDDVADAAPNGVAWLEFITPGTGSGQHPNATAQQADPIRTVYDIAWPPFVPKLPAGDTLRNAKNGLPDIVNWAAGAIIFDENEPKVSQLKPGAPGSTTPLNLTARLFDSMSERFVAFDAKVAGTSLTTTAGVDLGLKVYLAENGRYGFNDLPPHLKPRVRFDAINHRLILSGYADRSLPAAPLDLLNVLSTRERDELKAVSSAPLWGAACNQLYSRSINPNAVDATAIGAPGGSLLFGFQHRVDANGVAHDDIVPEVSRTGLTLTAGLTVAPLKPDGERLGFMTLAENNDPALGAAPVALHVVKITAPPGKGSLRVILSDNPLDEKVTIRHSFDFGGNPERFNFRWWVKEDSNGRPADNPSNSGTWVQLASGTGLNSVTIEGSGARTLQDQWIFCEYQAAGGSGLPGYWPSGPAFNRYAGDPSFVSSDKPMFVPGWIKRVLEGINPFEQRFKDFHESPATTYVSMIQQAGGPFQGAVALNGSAENLNNVGLIPLYETVLRRGLDLSLNGTPPTSTGGVNNALLLAASRISDLYMLLGNEAYADAQDPTIGVDPDLGGTINASAFAFQNQLPSLMEEELALLRGRDDSSTGVQAVPVFNRLFWNFSSGLEGEPIYVTNYGISDITGTGPNGLPNNQPDGFIRELDAATRFPMGHGDAWGHYLSAAKTYYRLLRHKRFTWTPRAEYTLVAGVPLAVDYLDEVKFARAAAARAKAAESITELTCRSRYTADPAGQWQGYKDTNTDRSWGADEWARRGGQGALLDWMVATAILPETDTQDETEAVTAPAGSPAVGQFNTSSVDKIDRTTVGELREIAASYTALQAVMDRADQGLNPLGLHNDVIPFDIDPSINEVGDDNERLTHFEQIYRRAEKSSANALRTFEHANGLTQRLRQIQLQANEFQQQSQEQELDLKNRLIEIFGYPYAGDIGPGKTYPTGYDGPDTYKWMYVDVAEVDGSAAALNVQQGGNNISDEFQRFSGFFTSQNVGSGQTDTNLSDNYSYYLDGVAQSAFSDQPLPVAFDLSTRRWAFQATPEMASRRAPGRIQMSLNEMLKAEAELQTAISNYGSLVSQIEDEIELLDAQYHFNAHELQVLGARNATLGTLGGIIATAKVAAIGLSTAREIVTDAQDTAVEGQVKVAGVFANDTTATTRLIIRNSADAVENTLRIGAAVAEGVAEGSEFLKEATELVTEIELVKGEQAFAVQERLKGIEQLMRNEVTARLGLFQLAQTLRGSGGDFQATLAEGQRLLEERLILRRKIAGPVQQLRYQDIAFRNFRNEALQRYKASFDLAARYTFLAAKTYDYETTLLGSSTQSGRAFLTSIVKQRSLGQFSDGLPVQGVDGLSDPMARMSLNFVGLKGQLGFTNPQLETGRFSLRNEMLRIGDADKDKWQEALAKFSVPDLNAVPEYRRFCRPFAPDSAGAQPGLVIEFPTTVTFGLNYFCWPLAGGDSSYDSSNFSTKILGSGVWFENYNGRGLALTPRVYLVPAGMDVLRSAGADSLSTREFSVVDQVLPVPFPIGANDLTRDDYIPFNDSLDNSFAQIRRHTRFRAYHDNGEPGATFPLEELSRSTRLVGRSVWNTRWLLIIPGGTFLANPKEGLDTFIYGQKIPGTSTRDGNGITDIKLFFETYAYSGL